MLLPEILPSLFLDTWSIVDQFLKMLPVLLFSNGEDEVQKSSSSPANDSSRVWGLGRGK